MTDKPESQDTKKRELVPIAMSGGSLQPKSLTEAVEYAKLIAHSGMIPKQFEGNVGAVLIAIQMGNEVGLPPLAALQNIAVINGRPSLWGDAVLAVVNAHPDCMGVDETQGDGWAKCVIRRRGRSAVERTFTVDDAKAAGLWGKQGPWTQYPKRMLQMRARGFACRDSFPDALRGIAIAEEVRDYDVIDAEPASMNEPPPAIEPLKDGTHSFGFRKDKQTKPRTAEQVIDEQEEEPGSRG